MTRFTRLLNALRAELRDATSKPHTLAELRTLLKLSTLLNELEMEHDKELAAAERSTEIEQLVADVIPLFSRHDVD